MYSFVIIYRFKLNREANSAVICEDEICVNVYCNVIAGHCMPGVAERRHTAV